MISLELEASFDDEATARAVLAALGPDNAGYVDSELRGSTIVFRMSSESAGTLRSTADDLLACLKTAEASAGIGRRRRLDVCSDNHRLYTGGCGRDRQWFPMTDIPEIAERLASGGEATDAELASLLTAEGPDLEALFDSARRVRDREFGKRTYLYGFVYFSTYCRNECSFCYYRRSNDIDRYRKSEDELVELARHIKSDGLDLADLTMGEDPYMIKDDYSNFLDIVRAIKEETGLNIMASPGAVPEHVFPELRDAGADICACYQETYNRRLFADRRLGQDFDYRRNQKIWPMRCGMLAEDGMMVGIGETVQDRVDTIREMVSLGCDQIRAMAFVPQAGTPMQDVPTASSMDELRCIAVMRLLQHDAFIPATLDVEGIAGMRTRLDAGASTVTSIIPAASHLAGVAQSEMDIEDGHRCADYVIARLKEMDREPATASDLKREFDRRKRRLADRSDLASLRRS